MRFGFSLSSDDVFEAIRCNVRMIIAEAPYYRYLIERPNNGWRIDADVVSKRYSEVYREIIKKYGASLTKHHAKNIIQHLTIKKIWVVFQKEKSHCNVDSGRQLGRKMATIFVF